METSKIHIAFVALLAAVLVVGIFGTSATLATTGNNTSAKAPYYENQSTDVANESWTADHEDPTLANFTHYLTRVGGFVIGDGGQAQGGGSANGIIVGLVFMAAFVGVAVGTGVGSVAGAVLATIGIGGLVTAAVAPAWIYPVLLFVLGGLLSLVAIRLWR